MRVPKWDPESQPRARQFEFRTWAVHMFLQPLQRISTFMLGWRQTGVHWGLLLCIYTGFCSHWDLPCWFVDFSWPRIYSVFTLWIALEKAKKLILRLRILALHREKRGSNGTMIYVIGVRQINTNLLLWIQISQIHSHKGRKYHKSLEEEERNFKNWENVWLVSTGSGRERLLFKVLREG